MTFSPKIAILLLSLTCITLSATAQFPKDLSDEAISQHAMDSLSKMDFARMVAGADNVADFANYLSFVPTDAKFKLAGNAFIGTGHIFNKVKRPHEYFAITFNGAGSIIGGNVATLFSDGKLNTGTDLGLALSWRMNVPNTGSITSDNQVMTDKRNALYKERNRKIDSAKNVILRYHDKIEQSQLALSELNRKTVALISDTAKVRLLLLRAKTDSARLKYADSLTILKTKVYNNIQKIDALKQDTVTLQELYDVSNIDRDSEYAQRSERQKKLSAKYGLNRKGLSYGDTVSNKIWYNYQKKVEEVELARPVSGLHLNWLSLIGNWNRSTYRTYDPGLDLSIPLNKKNFDGYTVGLQFNFYSIYKPVQHSNLLNFGLQFKRTNNLGDLTTSKLSDETVVPIGNTNRKSTTDYNVYTDPVEVYNTIQLPINYYQFFGKNLAYGWHAFGLADWRSSHKNVYNVGAGFVFGLNTADSKRLFNIELFATYKDLKRDLIDNKDDSKWKQLQIGFSVAIPFMNYKN